MLIHEKYRGGRFWAVYENGVLLCVTVYKKGARAVIDRISHGAERKEDATHGSPNAGIERR